MGPMGSITTIAQGTDGTDRDKPEGEGRGDSRSCPPPRSQTAQRRTGEMTFNVRLVSNPPQCPHSVKYKEGLERYEVTRQTAPPLPPGRTLALPPRGRRHTRTHADHTDTAQTHARVPTVKYMYRGTLLDMYRERDGNPGRRRVPQALSMLGPALRAVPGTHAPARKAAAPLPAPLPPGSPTRARVSGRRRPLPPRRPPSPHDGFLPRGP